jgi:hypothetical protein
MTDPGTRDPGDLLADELDVLHGQPLTWHKHGSWHASTFQAFIDWEKASDGRGLVHARVTASDETRQTITFAAGDRTLQLAAFYPDMDFPTVVATAAIDLARLGPTPAGRSRVTWDALARQVEARMHSGPFGSPPPAPDPAAALLAVLLLEHGEPVAAMRVSPGPAYLELRRLREFTQVALAQEALEHADDARRIQLGRPDTSRPPAHRRSIR